MKETKDITAAGIRKRPLPKGSIGGLSTGVAVSAAHSDFFSIRHSLNEPAALIAAAAGAAILIGYNIAAGHWLYVLAIAFGACVLLGPVPVSLGGFALLVPFDEMLALGQPGSSRTLTWFIGCATAVILLFTGLAGKRLKKPPASCYWWLLFGLWALVSAAWALDPQLALQNLPSLFALLALYVIAGSFRANDEEIRWISILSIFGGVVAALVATHQFYQGHFYEGTTLRGSLIIGDREVNPNAFSIALLLPMALAVEAFVSARGRLKRMVMLAASTVLAIAVFLTMSRGAVLAVVVMISVYIYRCRKIWRRFKPLLLLFLFPMLLVPSLFYQRLGEAGETGGAGRLDIWMVSWEAWKRHAVFGAGFANFPSVFTEFAGHASKFVGFGRDAHNIFIAVAVELGLVGLILFLAAVSSAFRGTITAYRSMTIRSPLLAACEAACWATLVCSFFDNTIYSKAFWLSFIFLLMVTQSESRHAEMKPVGSAV